MATAAPTGRGGEHAPLATTPQHGDERTRRAAALERVTSRWQLALDAAQRALDADTDALPGSEVTARRLALTRERERTSDNLVRLARVTGAPELPWLSPVPVEPRLLGLSSTVEACLFDLDGVLVDSGAVHAWAWAQVLDEYLLRVSEQTGWQFIPFDADADYHAYIDGRSRLEGVRAFLDGRGIRLPEGRPDDPFGVDTVWGLANRKGEALERRLRQRGVASLPGARRYLEAVGHAGIARAVVSASATSISVLELAGLTPLVEEHVDGERARAEGLRSRPAPDLLLAACRSLDVDPAHAIAFTHIPAGVAAAHSAGIHVVGVGDPARAELLRQFGADEAANGLTALLDPRLARLAARA